MGGNQQRALTGPARWGGPTFPRQPFAMNLDKRAALIGDVVRAVAAATSGACRGPSRREAGPGSPSYWT